MSKGLVGVSCSVGDLEEFYVVVFLGTMGLFHETSLPNKPGLFQLVWFIVTWFGFRKQIYHSSSSVPVATYAEKLTWGLYHEAGLAG